MPEEKTGKLKQEVEELRYRVQKEAEEVERRLSFSGIMDDVMARVKSDQYRELLTKNPLALILVGTGIGMMFRKRPEAVTTEGEGEQNKAVKEKAGQLFDTAKAKVAHLKERVQSERGDFDEKRKAILGQIREKRSAAVGSSRNFIAEYPVAIASGGLILGALVGVAISSRKAQ
ncbi:MAG TPA: hypothetical protein DCS07_09560 [Bdellovibrionales bacterium]|nr:MAG: hypothetical protein A2X97_02885 [Bdellovibrionales bacterium GWA1_52_35]OFZ39968.1 MAG: hypothetical protein A2070_07960 [Bdellovibrionales bacterium GWC1_52_8]HAR42858.1 hypothetical protein [Bdellovibrionales bacterium]HCM40138.1 hypothetical protein [Bdellovibrionales bacterium]